MKNCVTLKFNGQEIIIPKSNIKFHNGYGIIEAFYYSIIDGEMFHIKGRAVVDKDYKVIIDFEPHNYLTKIEILPNDSFIYIYKSDNDELVFYDATYSDGELRVNVSGEANDFWLISDSIVKLDVSCSDIKTYILYNVNSKEIITDAIHYVGEFSYREEYHTEVAQVCYYIYDDDYNIIEIISYFIDTLGNILSDYSLINSKQSYSKNINREQIVNLFISNRGR